MNPESSPAGSSQGPQPQPQAAGCLPAGLRRFLWFSWKYFLGAVLCMGPFASLLVIGWSYRLVRRWVLYLWWERSELRWSGTSFRAFLEQGPDRAKEHLYWPNWFLQQNFGQAPREGLPAETGSAGRPRQLFRTLTRSLWLNLKTGVQGILNTWVLTLPACLMWLFGWYGGWNNSFYKAYEEFWVGPLTGWLGVGVFIAVMFYLPMAQARQAATGDWRSFYQFRLIRSLVRQRWLACLLLAALYSAVSVPVTVLKTAPVGFSTESPDGRVMTDKELVKDLNQYFFWSCVVVFPAYVGLRLAAGWVYASALPAAVEAGNISLEALGVEEREDLERLKAMRLRGQPQGHFLIRWLTRTGTRIGRLAAGMVAVFLWFSFVAQIFVSEFLNYHPFWGWLNQPLVQLPWFHYIPQHLMQ